MRPSSFNFEATKLSRHVDIATYKRWVAEQNRDKIVEFVRERFAERFLRPLFSISKDVKHGFCIMALSCMLTEAVISYQEGWQETTEKRKKPYRTFFREHPSFGVKTTEQADDLYDNVRSGILHLGETYGGWRVHRKGPLVDFTHRTINATRYAKEVEKALDMYCEQLERAPWKSEIWGKLRDRMHAVIKHCEWPA
jgi:hypothetical protein